jgi:hypothetical protein
MERNCNTVGTVIIYYDPFKAAVYTYLTNGFWTWARTDISPIVREVAPEYNSDDNHKPQPALSSYHCQSIACKTLRNQFSYKIQKMSCGHTIIKLKPIKH